MKSVTITKDNLSGEGVILANGKVVILWYGDIKTIVIYDTIEDLQKLHTTSIKQI